MRPVLRLSTRSVLSAVLIGICGSACIAQSRHITYRPAFGYDGTAPNDETARSSFSLNGRYVVFNSWSDNLVPGDENEIPDAFVLDQLTHELELVSITWDGQQINSSASLPRISANGRYVVFYSWADNMIPDDHNNRPDIFVRDRWTGDVDRVSVASDGTEGNDGAGDFDMTPDGRFIVFASFASNLVENDTNGWPDIFVHDRRWSTTERVSVSSSGEQADYPSGDCAISADGRFVAFSSQAHNLIEDDWNGWQDVFVHDRWTGETEIVSVSSDGELGDFISGWDGVDISANGRYVTFDSGATNLVDGDTNGEWDVFVHDRWTGETERVSVSSSGEQGGGSGAKMSDDGRYVVFWTTTRNFDSRDNNSHGDVYVHDRLKRTTTLCSISTDGEVSNDVSVWPSISGNGRFIGFESDASNLAPNDDNRRRDVFIHLRGW